MNQTIKETKSIYAKVWAAFFVVLLVFTWKLWLPGFTNFPRVPLADWVSDSAFMAVHYVAIVLLVASLIALFAGLLKDRLCAGGAAVSLAIIFCCNQHCLQPWAWQMFIFTVLLALLPIGEARKWIARVVISIYLYSAIGKFDYQFIHSLGQEFLEVVLSWSGQSDSISVSTKSKLVLLFPIGELLIAVGLLFRRTQHVAAWGAIGLHLALVLILSPLGLGHRWPVVIWNGVSVLLVVWLFLSPQQPSESANEKSSIAGRLAVAFAIVILAGPMLRPVQLWDHWLAWGLYSPSNSRVDLFIAESSQSRLDESLHRHLIVSNEQFGSVRFAMDQWSLDELGVPIYPQARFQKGAASKWLGQNDLLQRARLFEYSQSHPVTGERSRKALKLP